MFSIDLLRNNVTLDDFQQYDRDVEIKIFSVLYSVISYCERFSANSQQATYYKFLICCLKMISLGMPCHTGTIFNATSS